MTMFNNLYIHSSMYQYQRMITNYSKIKYFKTKDFDNIYN